MIDGAMRLWARLNRWMDRYWLTRVGRAATFGFLDHDALLTAGSMAYFAILSIFQVIVLAIVVLSFLFGEGPARDYVLDVVEQNTPVARDTASAIIDSVIGARGGVTVVSVILLLWSALAGFSALNRGIGRAFIRAPRRPFWRDKLVGLSLIGIAGALAIMSILIGLFASLVRQEFGDVLATFPGGGLVIEVAGSLGSLLVIFAVFLAIYRITPNRPVTLAEVWPGAVVGAIAFTLLRMLFTLLLTEVLNYDSIFGPIGAAISLLVFLYFASVVLLVGAEFARANVLDTERRRTEGDDRGAQRGTTV